MSATTHRLLRHMAWSNQRVFSAVQALPDEALDAYIVNPEWTAKVLLQHIVNGADWYVYCLTELPWSDIILPKTMSEIDVLKAQLADFDAKISSQADLPDGPLTIKEGDQTRTALRSTLLSEAIYHAAEHRTQLVDALESKGFNPISLDDIDLWAFESYERKQSQLE